MDTADRLGKIIRLLEEALALADARPARRDVGAMFLRPPTPRISS